MTLLCRPCLCINTTQWISAPPLLCELALAFPLCSADLQFNLKNVVVFQTLSCLPQFPLTAILMTFQAVKIWYNFIIILVLVSFIIGPYIYCIYLFTKSTKHFPRGDTALAYDCVSLCVYLSLRDELCDFLARVKWSHFNVGHPPVGPPWCLQNLIMLFKDLPETCEVQILQRHRREKGVRWREKQTCQNQLIKHTWWKMRNSKWAQEEKELCMWSSCVSISTYNTDRLYSIHTVCRTCSVLTDLWG